MTQEPLVSGERNLYRNQRQNTKYIGRSLLSSGSGKKRTNPRDLMNRNNIFNSEENASNCNAKHTGSAYRDSAERSEEKFSQGSNIDKNRIWKFFDTCYIAVQQVQARVNS